MKIQIASDLHLEFPSNRKWLKENPLKPRGDILLLAGDIILDRKKEDADFFYQYLEDNFSCIISTMGNHEFYNSDICYAYPSFFEKITANHYRINNYTLEFEGLKIIGSTLWSHIPDKRRSFLYQVMNDYLLIHRKVDGQMKRLLISNTNEYHKQSIAYIEKELSKDYNGKVIVFTHHLPSFDCIIKEYDNQDKIQNAFASDLNYLFENYSIDYWIFGHLHDSVDVNIGKTRVICNPLGYMREPQKDVFDRELIIEV